MHRKRKGQPLGCPFLFGYSSCPSPAISPSPRTTEQRSRRARQTLGNLAGFVDAAGFRWRQRLPASRVWRCAREARLVDWHAPLVPAPIRAPREGAAECSRVRPTTPSAQRATPRRPSPGCGASLPVSSHARPSATGRHESSEAAGGGRQLCWPTGEVNCRHPLRPSRWTDHGKASPIFVADLPSEGGRQAARVPPDSASPIVTLRTKGGDRPHRIHRQKQPRTREPGAPGWLETQQAHWLCRQRPLRRDASA